MKRRVAILISGRGSNMSALIEAAREQDLPAEIVVCQKASTTSTGDGMIREEIHPADDPICQTATMSTGTR